MTNEGLLHQRRAEGILQLVDKTEKEVIEQEEQVQSELAIWFGGNKVYRIHKMFLGMGEL